MNDTIETSATTLKLHAPPADERPGPIQPPNSTAEELAPESIVEAILFASDVPLAPARIAEIIGGVAPRDVHKFVGSLNEKYELQDASFRIDEISGGYQMLTLPAYNDWISKLLSVRQESKLSQAALETLAIVAYKQPILRADLESIRGVACGEVLNRLRELNLIKIVGRADDIGRPLLYGTTKKFLQVFGLGSLDDLPKDEELKPRT